MKRSAKQRPVLESALAEGKWAMRMVSTCMLLTKNAITTAFDEEGNVGDVKGGRGGGLSSSKGEGGGGRGRGRGEKSEGRWINHVPIPLQCYILTRLAPVLVEIRRACETMGGPHSRSRVTLLARRAVALVLRFPRPPMASAGEWQSHCLPLTIRNHIALPFRFSRQLAVTPTPNIERCVKDPNLFRPHETHADCIF